ncbi:glutamine-hydrolyzing GMP synthase [Candidatus Woesearchaeota archaeon]|nr:glutamine-hydrolyzing GMP synthase [Candidatus Woesearchaeota archaeon]
MILIIDMGSQYTHLITRRIRQLKVYSEIIPWTAPLAEIQAKNPEGIILSGGPRSVFEKNAPTASREIFEMGVPVLGVCYGHQLIAHLYGGRVISSSKEYGKETLAARPLHLLKGLGKKEQVWMSHGTSVVELPKEFEVTGSTPDCRIAAYAEPKRRIYGLQFHPEVQHTLNGAKILSNFLDICKCRRTYTVKGMSARLVEDARAAVHKKGVIMAVSGGVDSLVAARILQQATDNLHLVFVDNGLMRKDEPEQVKTTFVKLGFRNFHAVDASELFLKRLKGITEPEEKRRIIGKAFINVFEGKVKEIGSGIEFLGQGTIYPDRIESAQPSKTAAVIKTHHNVGGLPKKMKLKLVEPLKDLYKDEVRELGLELGLENELLYRHPFPGPGLAVRIIGEVTKEKLELLKDADHIFIDELKKSKHYDKTWQAFAALLPAKAVGVMGDERTYGHIIVLRAVSSMDAMTADWARLPDWLLEKAASRIVRNVKGINRVLYDITQKPPATIEYE